MNHDSPSRTRQLLPLALAATALAMSPGASAKGPTVPPVQASSGKDDVRQILQAEHEICDAFEREDADWLEKHLDPTFTLTSSTGKVTTRADEVADLRSGTKYDVFRNRDSKVRVYGDAAVVTGITRVEGKSDGKPYSLDFQFTDTYVRKGGEWVIVASQAARLTKE